MKKPILAFLSLFSVCSLCAQQEPHYTQYILNQYILNPALTGIENYTDVKISHRHQWVGLQDAPVTTYLTIHTPLGKKDDRITATSYDMPGENPRGRNYWQDYEAAKPHHGIGLKIINDRTGPLNRFGGYLSYAYHLGISAKTSLAAGFEAGMRNISLDRSKLDFGSANPLDPAVYNSGEINRIKPDLGAGLYLYSADYFVGLSAQQILAQKIYFSDQNLQTGGSRLVPHLFLTAGYRFFLSDDFTALPSAMIKWVDPLPIQYDLNVKVQYLDRLWGAASYRLQDGFAAMLGINVSNTFNVGYSYDYSTSRLKTVSKGTHEIVLGFLIGNKYGDTCPRNVW
ncbi:MAG: type IX secretion system membrane protein PorP/SprF [Williamsia sp.]|nr:type IX secretion system membrane protein PorP/SprF [Williamsia sp.]